MNPFERIYRDNLWNGIETRSGPGSGPAATRNLVRTIQLVVLALDVHSVVDAACGEGWWQPDLPEYLGLDVSRTAIAAARQHHPDRRYKVHDVRRSCPRGDLVLCRDAMQHLPLADGLRVLDAVMASGSSWLLASTYQPGANADVEAGGYYNPDLAAAPFDLGPPHVLLPDGYDYADPALVRDPSKYLGLWRLHV